MELRRTTIIGYLLALGAAFFFGLSTPINKILLYEISPLVLSGWIYILSGLLLIPSFFIKHNYEKIQTQDMNKIVIMVVFGSILGPLAVLYGTSLTSAFQTSLFLNFEVIFTIIIAFFIFQERVGIRGWAGIILIILTLIMWSINFSISGLSALWGSGIIFLLLGCLFWAIDNNTAQTLGDRSSLQITAIKGIAGGSFSLIVAFFLQLKILITLFQLLLICIVGFLSYGFSIVFFITSLKRIGTVKTSIIFSTSPFIGSILAVLINAEILSVVDIVIFLISLCAILLIVIDKHSHFHTHHAIEHIHPHDSDDLHHKEILLRDEKETKNESSLHRHERIEHSHDHSHDIHHRHKHTKE